MEISDRMKVRALVGIGPVTAPLARQMPVSLICRVISGSSFAKSKVLNEGNVFSDTTYSEKEGTVYTRGSEPEHHVRLKARWNTGVLEPSRRGVAKRLVHVAAMRRRCKTTKLRLSDQVTIDRKHQSQ